MADSATTDVADRSTRRDLRGVASGLLSVVASGARLWWGHWPLLLTIAAAVFWGLGNSASKKAGRVDMLSFITWSALVPPMLTWSSWFALVEIVSTEAGWLRDCSSFTRAAAV